MCLFCIILMATVVTLTFANDEMQIVSCIILLRYLCFAGLNIETAIWDGSFGIFCIYDSIWDSHSSTPSQLSWKLMCFLTILSQCFQHAHGGQKFFKHWLVICRWMTFCPVICQLFASPTVIGKLLLLHQIPKPMEFHIHCFCCHWNNFICHNPISGSIIHFYGCWCLKVA